MSKVQTKLYLEPELAEMVKETTERFRSAGRTICRNDVIVQLIEDGFRFWRREADMATRVESSVAKLIDQNNRQDRVLRTILLAVAEGDEAEYRKVIARIYGEEDIDESR